MYIFKYVHSMANCLLAVYTIFMIGCGEIRTIKLVPVEGKVTLDGEPLKTDVIINFEPDTAKGNTTKIMSSMGRVVNEGPNKGSYSLVTHAAEQINSGLGAPTGWYKVYLSPIPDPTGAVQKQAKIPGVDRQYMSPDTTPITIEVIENPGAGAYDIKIAAK